MSDNRLVTLVKRLSERTVKGKVSWEPTVKRDTYQCSFPEYVIQIYSRPSDIESDSLDYVLSILNEDNVVIESVDDVQLSSDFDPPSDAYKLMEAMHSAARRTALGTEAAIEALLQNLGED